MLQVGGSKCAARPHREHREGRNSGPDQGKSMPAARHMVPAAPPRGSGGLGVGLAWQPRVARPLNDFARYFNMSPDGHIF